MSQYPFFSALYAHSPHRDWECDASMIRNNSGIGYGEWAYPGRPEAGPIALGEPDPDRSIHPDIATQLVKGNVGQRLNVALGGGLRLPIASKGNDASVPERRAAQWFTLCYDAKICTSSSLFLYFWRQLVKVHQKWDDSVSC